MKYSFPILLLFSFLLITGCQNTDDMEDTTSAIKERTFTVTASMPEEDGSSTRLIASQEAGSKNIVLKWKKGDKIQLYFKSAGKIVIGAETEVKNISADGENAEFDVVVPDEVTGNFDLYGVHGAESEISDETILIDARPSNLDKLGDISIPIYFKKEDLSADFTATDVSFRHYGALQLLTFKNTANKKIALDARNIDFSGGKWYHDVEDAEQPVYDIVSGNVLMKEASFSPVASVSTVELSESDNLQLAQWIVPNGVTPPAVGLNLNIDGDGKTTATPKDARSEALKVGKAYHLYAVWNGDALDFTDEEAVQVYKMTMITSKHIGSTISLSIGAMPGDRGNIWVDWNNDGQKNDGEAVTAFNTYTAYEFTSPTITIYGKVTQLTCSSDSLTSLDITKNTALTNLICSSNSLTSLDITKNTALTNLTCSLNSLTSLDITKNTALTNLNCSSNSLTSLDITKNTALTNLICGSNPLTFLDVTKNTALTYLHCYSNTLTSLDVTNNTALTSLSCGRNPFTSLNVKNNTALTSLSCEWNSLTSLDVENNTALTKLTCNDNKLTSLDVTKNTALTKLTCNDNKLKELNVTKNTALKELICLNNQFTSLDVTNNTALTTLHCHQNDLTELKVKGCTALTVLWCYNNNLTSLDVSGCTALTYLNCSSNELTALDVRNTALKDLYCCLNAISRLAMDNLINYLPNRPESSKGSITVIYASHSDEKNVCTKAQVATATLKGWNVMDYYPNTAYPGSE